MATNDLQKAPKVFCESVKMGHTKEYFIVALSSGEQSQTFAFTPEHAKRLLGYLEHHVETYEKKHGTIDAKWDPNIVSPLQLKKKD